MGYTASGLVEYCKKCADMNTAYMWGGLMQSITDYYITYKSSQYPSSYTTQRKNYLKTLVGKNYYGCDCVGLIKSYYFGGVGSPNYDASKDVNTNGMFDIATEKGSINNLPEIPGLILYMGGHVGVYAGNGEAYECTLGDYGDGVVKTKVEGRGWTRWLKIPYIEYPETSTPKCPYNCPYCNQGYMEVVKIPIERK